MTPVAPRIAVLIATVLALALVPDGLQAQSISGSGRAIDGDTIALNGVRIRLLGIDAPEARQTCQRSGTAWQCGAEARAVLESLIAGRRVSCEQVGRDRYGRIVAVCSAAGQDLSRSLVRTGLATALPAYSDAYIIDQDRARADRLGIWASRFEQPAAYRAVRRAAGRAAGRVKERRSVDFPAPRPLPVEHPIAFAATDRPAVLFGTCGSARAAGAAPLRRGQAGYRSGLDRDGDGLACEPFASH